MLECWPYKHFRENCGQPSWTVNILIASILPNICHPIQNDPNTHVMIFLRGNLLTKRIEHSHPVDSSQACSKSWYFEKIYIWVQTQPSDAHWNCHLRLGPKQISWFWTPLVTDINSIPSYLNTRPKLILNAEPLVNIHIQVLVVLLEEYFTVMYIPQVVSQHLMI